MAMEQATGWLTHCNSIEAPWLANGGHGASFRHHKGGQGLAAHPWACASSCPSPCPRSPPSSSASSSSSSCRACPWPRPWPCCPRRRRRSRSRRPAPKSAAACRRGHTGNSIEAPWLVNGGHGASLKQRRLCPRGVPFAHDQNRRRNESKRRGISAAPPVRIMQTRTSCPGRRNSSAAPPPPQPRR
jgi:hypothetical protein